MPKITNPSRLLPSAKSTSITKITKNNLSTFVKPIKKSSAIVKTDRGSSTIESTSNKKIEEVNVRLLEIKSFLNKDLLSSKKKAETKRKQEEKKDFEEAEKKLETPQSKKLNLSSISLPSIGLFDRIKRFLFFTALGWLVPKIIEFLPKLQRLSNIISGVYKFAEGLFGNLFNGFMSLVKFGGDLKKQTLGFIAELKVGPGGDYESEFKKLQTQFDTFVNASIIAGVLGVDIGLSAVDEYNKWKRKSESVSGGSTKLATRAYSGRRLTPQELKDLKLKPGSVEARAIQKPGTKAERLASRQQRRIEAAQIRAKLTKPKPKVSWWKKLTDGIKGKIGNIAGKLAGPFSKFAGAAVPGLGAAIGFADANARSKSGDKLGAFLAGLSASLDAFTAAVALAGLGAAATGVGLPGAAVLAAVATAAGTISLSIDVILLIRDILKTFGVPVFNKGGRVLRKYQGGGTTGRPVGVPKRRSITPQRKKLPLIKPPKSQPGKDVGGEKNIKKLFPDKSKRFITNEEYENSGLKDYGVSYTQYLVTERKNEGKKPSPYKALTNTAKILKEIPLVGGIMGAAVDVALGQKPDRRVYQSLSNGISNIVNALADQKASKSMNSLIRDIRGFAEGGTVESSRDLKQSYGSLSSGDMIAKVLGTTIEDRVNEAINSIEKEMKKIQQKKNVPGGPGGGGGGGGGGGDGGGMLPGDAPPEVKAALEAIAGAEGGWDSVNPGKVVPGLRNMTIAQAREVGMKQRAIEGSGALGKFQQIPVFNGVNILKQRAEAAGLNYETDKFNEENQTKIARAYIAGIYPGGEAQLIKDARKDPMILADKLKNVYPSLPGGDQPNVNTPGYLDRYNRSLEKYRVTLSPGKIPKADYVKGVLDESGEPGFDVTWKGNNNIAILPGRVKEVGQLYGSAYGNVVVVESTDPVNGKKVDVLYAHFPDGGISVTAGQQVSTGQVLGRMGKPGEPGIGNITGQHASIDFYEPNKNTKYSRWDGLSREIISSAQTGNNPSNWPKPESQPDQVVKATNKPTTKLQSYNASDIASANLNDRISKLKPGEKIVFDKVGSIQLGKGWFGRPQIKYYNSAGSSISKEDFDKLLAPSEVLKKMKSNDRQVQNMKDGGVVKSQKSKLPIPNSFASYESPGGKVMVAIQVIEKPVPIQVSSGKKSMIDFIPVSVNSNNKTSSLSIG